MGTLRSSETPLDLETVGWLELQLLVPADTLEAGTRIAATEGAVSDVRQDPGGGVSCTVDDGWSHLHEVRLSGAEVSCDCTATDACAHACAALAVWIEQRDGTGLGADAEAELAGGPPDQLPDLLTHILREAGPELHGRVDIDSSDGAGLVLDLTGEDGVTGRLKLPASWLPKLVGLEGRQIDLSERVKENKRPDAPLTPVIHADYDDEGRVRLHKRYSLDDRVIDRDSLDARSLDGTWAWVEGTLHPIAPVPSPLRRAWNGPELIPSDAVFEFVRTELPALRRCPAFVAGEALDAARVVRNLRIQEVAVEHDATLPWFYLEPLYGDGDLVIALDELRTWRDEGRTRVRHGDVWIEVPPAAELERIASVFGAGNQVSASDLLMLSAGWDGRVDVRTSPETRQLLDRLFAQAPPEPAAPPAAMQSTLREYQQAGYGWLSLLARLSLGGILADEMGLGKTHQAMALLAERHASEAPAAHPSLVVCPRSVLHHWARKLAQHVPALTVKVHHGSDRHAAAGGADVWVTTYETVVRDITSLEKQPWDLLIADEAQRAKNARTQIARGLRRLDVRARFALTGTPIENTLAELWSLFDLLLPGYLGPRARFNKRFTGPIEKDGDEAARIHLGRLVRPLILRRKKSEVLRDLPDKIEDDRTCVLSAQQEVLYLQALQRQAPRIIDELGDSGKKIDYIHILAVLTRLKQICDHPALVLGEEEQGEDPLALDSGKFDLWTDLVAEATAGGNKVVVFTQYLGMLDLMRAHLTRERIGHVELRGATVDREGVIDRFDSEPDCQVFLASLMAGGTGIDLTAATTVIHYDRWWNAAREDQATDRIHRIGQTRGVQVIRLITHGTIEERIDQLIRDKAALSGDLIDSDVGALRQFDRNELIDLLQGPVRMTHTGGE